MAPPVEDPGDAVVTTPGGSASARRPADGAVPTAAPGSAGAEGTAAL